jgi:hypothetical protein
MEYQNKFENRNLNKSGLLGQMRPTAELCHWTGLAAACQAGPLRNGVQPDTAQPANGASAQSTSAPRRRAWSARDGGVTAGSPAAEVHRQVYAEHEHLHVHSPGTYTTAGSSRGDGASEAATGSPVARWIYGIRRFPCFRFGGEITGGWGIAACSGDWTRVRGVKLSPVTAVGASRAAAGWRFRAPLGVPAQEEG